MRTNGRRLQPNAGSKREGVFRGAIATGRNEFASSSRDNTGSSRLGAGAHSRTNSEFAVHGPMLRFSRLLFNVGLTDDNR
jgi:hypothetical protein